MTTRIGRALSLAAAFAVSWAVVAGAQGTSGAPAQGASAKPATKPASSTTSNLKMVELMPLTCAQAWAVSGRDYSELYRMVAALATVSLANRDLAFPNTKEAGTDAGNGIAKDCLADPQGLLFGIVDQHVRRVATPRK